jgi:hypothetical protein
MSYDLLFRDVTAELHKTGFIVATPPVVDEPAVDLEADANESVTEDATEVSE